MKITKSQLKEIIREVITEKRLLQAISGSKVHPFITAKRIILKGKSYDEVDFELLSIDNRSRMIRLKVLAPKNIFGDEINVSFRDVRRGPWFKTDTSKVNESLSYYLANAKERLKDPHTITDILFKTTSRGDKYVQINYKYKYVPGKMIDPHGQFVSIFYDSENDLKRISRELKLKLKESVVNESIFVLHYGEGRNRFAHELKAFTLKDALKKFIDMYKIPKEEWDKIVVRKNKWF